MEKSLKFCLSLFCLVLVFSCKKETNLSLNEKQILAEETYKKAIQFTQGSTAFQNGIADAVAINSNYETAVYELSVAHLKRGMPHKWLPQYNKAVKLDSITRIPWRGYLYLWFYRDYKKAIADFNASDTLTPNYIDTPQGHDVDYWRGIAYLGLKDYKKSLAFFNKHIIRETEEWGDDSVEVTAFLYRGIVLLETGNYTEALKDFDKVIFYNREHSADAKYYKAIIFKDTNSIKAKTFIEASIEDFNNGYYNQRPYVETMRQLYLQDLELLNNELQAQLKS